MGLKAPHAGMIVREGTTEGPGEARRLTQRERLIAAAPTATSSSWRGWMLALGVVAMATTAILIGLRVAPTSPVQEQTVAADPVHIAFTDGSRVELAEGARGHVATNGPSAVQIVLESGHLDASVEPKSHRAWTIQAGPFEVRVVGTVFAVDWDEHAQQLTVQVERGEVNVRGGPSLPGGGVAISAGRRLHASVRDGTVSLTPSLEVPAVEAASDEAGIGATSGGVQDTGTSAGGSEDEVDPSLPRRRPTPPDRKAPTWLSEASAGHYAEALDIAKALGFDRLVESLGATELARLADTARLAKDRDRAETTYQAIRRRFPGTKVAGQAAFYLGRLHASSPKGQRRAIEWFRTYLTELPGGAFVREARGRLMQSLVAVGEHDAATSVAKRYLEADPTGPHAKLAKSLVE